MLRRHFLQAAAGLAAGGALSSGARAQALDAVRLQLGWISDVSYGELWVGLEEGLFAAENVDLTTMVGGPNAPSSLVQIAAGNAEIGIVSWLPFLDAVKQGNDFVLIGARQQVSPLGVLSLASKPLLTPKDLVGSRLLTQGPSEQIAIEATLSLAGLPPKEWTNVPAGFSPDPLLAGDGDGYTGFATTAQIAMEQQGLKEKTDYVFRTFDDLGFKSYSALLFCQRAYLEENRGTVVGFMRALIRSFEKDAADPALAARLTVDKYGVDYGLDLDQQTRVNELQLPYFRPSPDFPVFSMDKEKVAGAMYAAARATGRTDLPDVHKIVDTSVVEEAFATL